MARPVRRPAPSPRVWAAFAIAALVGIGTFSILWFTSPKPPAPPAVEERAVSKAGATVAPAAEFVIPRGGSLAGALPPDVDQQDALTLLTHARLFRVNRSTDQVEPWLAESSSASADHLTYTIKLRPNILRADGSALVAEDVVSAFAARAPMVAGKPVRARAIDPLTVEIVFPSPFAPALRLFDTVPIQGLGPFLLTERAPGGRLIFARNPSYSRLAPDGKPLPYLDGLVLESRAARPDQLDFNEDIRPADYRALRRADQEGKLRLYDLGPGLDADALWMNLSPPATSSGSTARGTPSTKPWLRRDEFRQAISAAIDRRAFCDIVFSGMCDPIAGAVTPGSAAWFVADLPARHGLELARATLAGLGLQVRTRDGFVYDEEGRPARFSLLVPRGRDTVERGAGYLRDELRKIGIGVDITAIDPAVLRARWEKGEYEAIYDRIAVRDTDPAMNLDFWLSSGSRHMWNPRQPKPSTDWEARIDELMLKQAGTFDRVERLQLFAEVQRLFAEHVPAIYFGAPYVYVATSMRVLNARPSRLRPALLWNAESIATVR